MLQDATLEQLRQAVDTAASAEDYSEVRARLQHVAETAAEDSSQESGQLAARMAQLAELAVMHFGDSRSPTSEPEARQRLQAIRDFLTEHLDTLSQSLFAAPDAKQIERFWTESENEWGDWLSLLSDGDDWSLETASVAEPVAVPDEADEPSEEEVQLLLSALGSAEEPQVRPPTPRPASDDTERTNSPEESSAAVSEVAAALPPELLEAYLDDAQQCLASIESVALRLDGETVAPQQLRPVCRELHTLKGASATVGFSELAQFLHTLEDRLEKARPEDSAGLIEEVLKAVDFVRQQINPLAGNAPESANVERCSPSAANSQPIQDTSECNEPTLRVRESKLDRLMDMLAELVVLKNRRESQIQDLEAVQEGLLPLASQLRTADEPTKTTELANQLRNLARQQRRLCQESREESQSIATFVRQFRQELVQLRRMPIDGLFQRLQRAVREAAQAENKTVKMLMTGAAVGLERSLQEQLYEPLLHMVRNAVSHGIEIEQDRIAAGKSPCGTITLELKGGANALELQLKDDGRGLDYDAIRRRGLSQGLINADQSLSRQELAQLIFHPGFSTKQETTEISGRGVGMDVVAATLDRLRSWIDIDSQTGQGTTIKLTIPLRSMIEHMMVFRSAGRMFGIPMQFVQQVEHQLSDFPEDQREVDLNTLLDEPASENGHNRPRIVFGYMGRTLNDGHSVARVALVVDEIAGPEEIVVRPLPNLLQHQRLFTSLTLHGSGEPVLVFDAHRLLDEALAAPPSRSALHREAHEAAKRAQYPILVVDDSRTARNQISNILGSLGYTVHEARDGEEAWEQLMATPVSAVFTDLEMPRLDGLQLLGRIADSDRFQDLPVIMASSRQEDEYRDRARECGARTYLNKPVRRPDITQVLSELDLLCEA